MTERQVNMNYLKDKYISPTWENMLEECQDWYKEGLKQGKFDKEAEKQQLISFLEDKIKEYKEYIDTYKKEKIGNCKLYCEAKLFVYQEVLDFIEKGGDNVNIKM